jgi:hypothetical protein
MKANAAESTKKWSQQELIAQLDYALALALDLNHQIDGMDAALEEAHRMPVAA